jgi:hypothetical protein
MDVEAEFEALELPADKESHAWEARAKITWGEPRDDVFIRLVSRGITRRKARQIVEIALRERSRSMRLKGVRDLVIGLVLLVVAAALP